MAKKRIITLLIVVISLLGMIFPVSAADFNVRADHTYQGFNGYVGNGSTVLGVSANVPTPLLSFVETDHNSYEYTLDFLTVVDINGNTFLHSRAEVLRGASFAFPNNDYYVEIEYDTDVIITATAGSGGQIDNDDEYGIEVPYGSDMTYQITPNNGHYISDVKVDNVSVGAVAYYTFTTLEANHTIHAEFAPTTATAATTTGSDNSPTSYTLKYYKNIMDDESVFYMQSGFYKGDTATVTGRVPTRSGYRFLYWTANSTGWGERYLSGDKLEIRRNTNLYANWEKEAAPLPEPLPEPSPEPSPSTNINDNPGTGAPIYPVVIHLAGLGCLIAAAIAVRKRRN